MASENTLQLENEDRSDPEPTTAPPDLGKAARRGGVWAVVSYAFSKATGFASSIVLARLLMPADFGLVGMVNTVLGLAQIVGNCGIGLALIHQRDDVEEYANTMWWLDLGFGFFLFCVTNLLSPFAAAHYHEPKLELLILVAGVNFLINPLGGAMDSLMQRDLRFKETFAIGMMQGMIASALSIVFVVLGAGVWSFIYPHVIANLAAVAMRWRKCSFRPRFRVGWDKAGKLVRFGRNMMGANIFRYVNENIDYVLVGALMGGKQLGLYFFAYNLGVWIVQNITLTVSRVMFPTFSSVQDDPDRARAMFLKVMRMIALIGFPIVCIQWATAPLYIGSIYGEKWLDSATAFRFIALYGMGKAVCSPALTLIAAMGRPDVNFKVNAAMSPVLVGAIVIGSRHGINGVALATALAHGLFVWLYVVIPFRILGWPISDAVKALLPPLASAIFSGALIGVVYRLLGGGTDSLGMLALLVGIGGASYVGLNALVFRSDSAETLALLKTSFREARGRPLR